MGKCTSYSAKQQFSDFMPVFNLPIFFGLQNALAVSSLFSMGAEMNCVFGCLLGRTGSFLT
jgi:hypothetical protein